MVFDGKVYHNLKEYIKAGFGQGGGGGGRSEGELVFINGVNALHFHNRAAYMQEDAPFEEYVIIRNVLIYQIDLKTDDPFREEFLRSFNLLQSASAINSSATDSGARTPARGERWTGKAR